MEEGLIRAVADLQEEGLTIGTDICQLHLSKCYIHVGSNRKVIRDTSGLDNRHCIRDQFLDVLPSSTWEFDCLEKSG